MHALAVSDSASSEDGGPLPQVSLRSLSDGQCVQDSLCLGGFFASGRAGILGLQCPIRKTLSSVMAGTPSPPPGSRGAALALANLFLITSSPG